jgi:hypothetical protein
MQLTETFLILLHVPIPLEHYCRAGSRSPQGAEAVDFADDIPTNDKELNASLQTGRII